MTEPMVRTQIYLTESEQESLGVSEPGRLVVDTDVLIEHLSGRAEAAAFLHGREEELIVSDARIAERAGELRRRWHRSHGTGLADAFIAATAIELGADLASFNQRHFPMLEVVVPYRRG